MPAPVAIAAGLHGAFLLARARPWGLLLFEDTPAGVARSFVAMAFCLPAYLTMQWLDEGPGTLAVDPLRAVVAQVIGFGVAWLAFAAISHQLAEALGRGSLWLRFLAAWNWSNVVQYAAMVVAWAAPALLGLPTAVSQVVGLVALGYALWVEWYVTRLALQLPGMGAAAIVLIDLAIGLMTAGFIQRLAMG